VLRQRELELELFGPAGDPADTAAVAMQDDDANPNDDPTVQPGTDPLDDAPGDN